MDASFLVKYGHKVIVINVISFVIYFGVSTLLMNYSSLQYWGSNIVAFIAAVVVHEALLIMNRPPPDLEAEASDIEEEDEAAG